MMRVRVPQLLGCRLRPLLLHQHLRRSSQHRVYMLPEVPTDTATTNRLMKPCVQGLPEFNAFKNERVCYFGLGKTLLQFESQFNDVDEQLQHVQDDSLDFERVFKPLEESRCQLETVWSLVNLMHCTTNIMDKNRFLLLHRRADRALVSRFTSRTFHATLKKLKDMHEKGVKKLSPDELRLVDKYLDEYHLDGYDLDGKTFDSLHNTWNTKLSDAKAEYDYRLQMASSAKFSRVGDPNVMRDFPIDVLKVMAVDSEQPQKGPWRVTNHPYIVRQFLSYCPDRHLRFSVFKDTVDLGRDKDQPDYRLSKYAAQIRTYARDKAITLGFNCYNELSAVTKMVGNVDNVLNMIANLAGKAKEGQERELEELQRFAEERGFDNALNHYDIQFYQRKQLRTKIGVSNEELRPFFPLPKVFASIVNLCHRLLDIRIELVNRDEYETWHPEVQLFRVVDNQSNELKGHFYYDPYIRDDKVYEGADRGWFVPLRPRSRQMKSLPLGCIVTSYPCPPSQSKPALLNFEEAKELFRCFGNALMHVLSDAQWADLAGKTAVKLDAMDIVPNVFASLMHVPEVISKVSGHWSSNEQLSQEVITALCESKSHMSGLGLCQELFKAHYDLEFYSDFDEKDNLLELRNRLHSEYLLLPFLKEDGFPLYFSEIISGEFAAAYYTKLWSRMCAADVFQAFEEKGWENEQEIKEIMLKFRSTFLELSGSVDETELFRMFRARDPHHRPLLNYLGLYNETS